MRVLVTDFGPGADLSNLELPLVVIYCNVNPNNKNYAINLMKKHGFAMFTVEKVEESWQVLRVFQPDELIWSLENDLTI